MDYNQNKIVEFFTEFVSRSQENSRCFDCSSEEPVWASINNGVLICLVCASKHRMLGLQASHVRSIKLDHWTEQQMALMNRGGNNKLRDFLEKYDFKQSEDLSKYTSRAAQFYRCKLDQSISSEEMIPTYSDGILPYASNITTSTDSEYCNPDP